MDKRIMIVDDDPHIRLAVTSLLGREGLGVIEAAGGQECMEVMQQGFHGVILMDVMMPGMNGWDTMRSMVDAGVTEGSVIFMLTALDYPEGNVQGLEEYVTDYLTKPFENEKLVSTVKTYLEYVK